MGDCDLYFLDQLGIVVAQLKLSFYSLFGLLVVKVPAHLQALGGWHFDNGILTHVMFNFYLTIIDTVIDQIVDFFFLNYVSYHIVSCKIYKYLIKFIYKKLFLYFLSDLCYLPFLIMLYIYIYKRYIQYKFEILLKKNWNIFN